MSYQTNLNFHLTKEWLVYPWNLPAELYSLPLALEHEIPITTLCVRNILRFNVLNTSTYNINVDVCYMYIIFAKYNIIIYVYNDC